MTFNDFTSFISSSTDPVILIQGRRVISKELEVTLKTIQRDITFMRWR